MNKDFFWKVFISWLKYNNFFEKFYFNLSNCSESWKTHNLKNKFLKDVHSPHHWIMFAYDWSETVQGHDFWYRIHLDWCSFYNSIREKRNLNQNNYGRMFIRNS